MHTTRVNRLGAVTHARLATVTLQTPLLEAAQQLSQTHIGLVVVCDPDGVMAGVVSKGDIVRQIGHCQGNTCHTLVSERMTTKVICCQPWDLLSDVLAVMQEHGLVHMPVLDAHQRPLGVVNARDALRALVAEGEYEQSLLLDYVIGVGYH